MSQNDAGAVSILTYHSLDSTGSVISTSPEKFSQQMETLIKSGVPVVRFRDLVQQIRGKRAIPTNAVAITFDDGFRNVYDVAFPILKQCGFPATVFLVTDHCGKENRWDGQPDNIPVFPLLDWDRIAEMSAENIEFGVHTASHPDLSKLNTQRMTDEILGSREELQKRLGQGEYAFAFPYGKAPASCRDMIENNFYAACSTRMDFVSVHSDLYFLPRIDMYYFSKNRIFSRIGTSYFRKYVYFRKTLRSVKQRMAGD